MRRSIVFSEGTIVDGSGRKPIDNGVLVVEEGKIAVGARDIVRVPSDATKIDCSGKTVMPGLIDCHVHLSLPQEDRGSYTGFGITKMSVAGWAIESVANARKTLEAGITTVRDVGALPNVVIELRNAVNRGTITGPRILSCNMGICMTGSHGDTYKRSLFEGFRDAPDITTLADGADGVRRAVRQQIRAGADWIKAYASGGALEAQEGKIAEYSIEELRAITEEASRAGKKCAAHCVPNEQIGNCVDAGFSTIEHGVYARREVLEKMKDKQVSLDPTLTPYFCYANENLNLPDATIEVAKKASKVQEQTFKIAMETGVNIATGTDAGAPGIPVGFAAKEVELMVKFGMTPSQAVSAGTMGSAKALGIDRKVGTLEPEKVADVLVVKGDVLRDVTLLQRRDNLDVIMMSGSLVKSANQSTLN